MVRVSVRARHVVFAIAATIAVALCAQPVIAQSAVFTGKVTSSGQPVGGATVGIGEFGVGSVTSVDGRYTFTVDVGGRNGRTVNVMARFIGYKPMVLPITLAAGRTEKDFDLEKDVLNLESVVVTGVSDATSTRKVAFAVGVVDAEQLKNTPATTPLASLAGKVAGAAVTVGASAQPGSEPSIRLRAATSLTGRQDPLVIVDGTITRLGLADVNTQDVERVEVIKGAAASSLYGSDAANGVIQIFTRRGANLAEGQRMVTLRNEIGSSWLPKFLERNNAHEFEVTSTGAFALDANGNRIPKADRIADNAYPVYYDQMNDVFHKSLYLTNYLSIGERRGPTNFSVSFENQKETGVLAILNGYSRQNFRVNVDHVLNDKVDFSSGAFYGRSAADQTAEGGSVLFGMRFLEPNIDINALNKDGSPYNAVIKQPPASGNVVNPLYGLANNDLTNNRDRFSGTVKARYRPVTWLTAEGNFNYDQSGATAKSFTPIGYLNSSGAAGTGFLARTNTQQHAFNTGATLTATRSWRFINNTTKIAYVYEDQQDEQTSVSVSQLTVPKVTEFAAAAVDPDHPVRPGSLSQTTRTRNSFIVSTFDMWDKLVVDGLIRRDESSLFGSSQRGATYHRASVAYRVSEDFKFPGVDEFKLRASYGTAGLRPPWDAQYELFAIVAGSPQKVTLGNPNLKPAFSKETEVGFNINFLRDFSVEYSYSDKKTSDQILNVPVSSASGYQNRWTNAGTLAGQTHELSVGAVLFSRRDLFWRVNIAADRTRQKISELTVAPFLVGPNGVNGGGDGGTRIFRIAKGEPFGVIYGSRWIRTAEQLATTIAAGGLGSTTAADYTVNEEGYYVLKSAYRTVNEKPLKFRDATGTLFNIGDVNPDFTLSTSSSIQWKGLAASAVLQWNKGGHVYNYTRQWPFNEERDAVYDQRRKAAAERKPAPYYQTFYNNFDASEYFVEDGGYMKLRELSVYYALPKSLTQSLRIADFSTARIGVIGRNLWTGSNYTGYDPDVSGPGGGNPFAYRVDYFTYPQYRTVTFVFELGY
ncbi:MAG: SusC/RagA family TonB-linked outer membrane protein [Gemmatimonadetes bacterium]|nr:SusC/RagA family TonB-linked outer membrane protein [Gemmatimonadota bacterium]